MTVATALLVASAIAVQFGHTSRFMSVFQVVTAVQAAVGAGFARGQLRERRLQQVVHPDADPPERFDPTGRDARDE